MSVSTYELSVRDFSNEVSRTGLTTVQLTAGNVVASLSSLDALLATIQAITLGNFERSRVVYREQNEDPGVPSDENAQRERKWLVVYHDTTTGKKFRMEIPTAKLTGNLVTGSDLADLGATDIAAFVTAFEGIAKDPDTGLNSVAVDYIKHVGKRL